MVLRCHFKALGERVNTFIPAATGVAHAGWGLGIILPPISTSTMHWRQLAAIGSLSWYQKRGTGICAASVAWMIVEPLGALTGWPSTSNSTTSTGGAVSLDNAFIEFHPKHLRPAPLGQGGGMQRGCRAACRGCGCVAPCATRVCAWRSCRHLHLVIHHRTPVLAVVLELVPEIREERLHRPRGGFAERADGVPFDLARDGFQPMQVFRRPTARDDARQHAMHPAGAFAARRALAAGFHVVELADALARTHHARRFV